MSKVDVYREALIRQADIKAYLLENSGLPGPRANLELLEAAADVLSEAQIEELLAYARPEVSTNEPDIYLALCGVVGLGRLLAEGQTEPLARLKALANDGRWRMREAVVFALQRLGDASMSRLLAGISPWARGSLLEQRALAAGLCEPRLLADPANARAVLALLDEITTGLLAVEARRADDFIVLRKGLAYCWSVAVAALPAEGKAAFERWTACSDPDVRWLVRENLKKNRLMKMDAAWVDALQKSLASANSTLAP